LGRFSDLTEAYFLLAKRAVFLSTASLDKLEKQNLLRFLEMKIPGVDRP
jgi:hypothetical protein